MIITRGSRGFDEISTVEGSNQGGRFDMSLILDYSCVFDMAKQLSRADISIELRTCHFPLPLPESLFVYCHMCTFSGR